MRIKSLYSYFLFMFFLVSCQSDTKYHSYRSTSLDGWNKGDILTYNIPDSLEKGIYRMEIGIRHSDRYKYKNLWIEVKSNFSENKKSQCDSIQLILSDDSGNWFGKGIGGLYQKDSLLNRNLIMPNKGKTKVSVKHIMRDKKLSGIRDVGIRLIKISD